MRAIRGRLFKGTSTVVSGCLIIVTSFEKSHPALLPVCFENITAISRFLGNTGGLLGGDLEDVKPPHHTVQQTFRGEQAPGFVLVKHGLLNLFWWRRGNRAPENGDAFSFG